MINTWPPRERTHPILIGGTTEFYDGDIDESVYDIDEVWILGVETEVWTFPGYMQKVGMTVYIIFNLIKKVSEASVIRIGEFVYVFPGNGDSIQRIDLVGDSMKISEVIGGHNHLELSCNLFFTNLHETFAFEENKC